MTLGITIREQPLQGANRGDIVERRIGWGKELRRARMRYDKLASGFKAMVCLSCIDRCLSAGFSDNIQRFV